MTLALLGLAGTALADSARIQWIGNKHFYQSFDTTFLNWFDAQTTCKSKGAHLTTITSIAENSFLSVNSKTFDPNNKLYFYIGATDATKEGVYTWVNGEKYVYSNHANQGSIGLDYSFLYIQSGQWIDDLANVSHAYICEWSAHNYIDITSVPDINANKFSETAVLYVDYVSGKHTVKIKDPQTQTVLSTLTFLTSFTPPQGLVALADLNGNKIPEIAVLYSELNQPSVGIKDAKANGALLKTLKFLDANYEPKAITATPDTNGNGASEITVLGIHKTSGAAKSETRDSKTGAILKSIAF